MPLVLNFPQQRVNDHKQAHILLCLINWKMKRSGGWLHFPDYFGGQMHSAGPNTSTTGFKHLDAGFVCFAMQPVKRAGICVVQGPQDFVKHADTPRQEAAERS